MARTLILYGTLLLGCSEYEIKGGGPAEPGLDEDTAQVPERDTSLPPFEDTSEVPESDTGQPPFEDTGCSVDLASWDLDARWARSAMEIRVQTESIGTCMDATVALPTSLVDVWDSGTYTPTDLAAEGVSDGRSWASWDQLGEVDCHHFALAVELPPCDWSALELSSPWFEGVPINDNLYILVDGNVVWSDGTDYGLVNGGGPAETGGWIAGEIVALPVDLLGTGRVIIDFVVEEREEWGGMGYIEPSLVP